MQRFRPWNWIAVVVVLAFVSASAAAAFQPAHRLVSSQAVVATPGHEHGDRCCPGVECDPGCMPAGSCDANLLAAHRTADETSAGSIVTVHDAGVLASSPRFSLDPPPPRA